MSASTAIARPLEPSTLLCRPSEAQVCQPGQLLARPGHKVYLQQTGVVPSPCLPPAVKLCLDQPLVGPPDIRDLAGLCVTAEAHLERVIRLNSADTFNPQVLTDVENKCKKLYPNEKPVVRASHASFTRVGSRSALLYAVWIRGLVAKTARCLTSDRAVVGQQECHVCQCVRAVHLCTQDVLQALGIYRFCPYLEQGMATGKLQPVDTHAGERAREQTEPKPRPVIASLALCGQTPCTHTDIFK